MADCESDKFWDPMSEDALSIRNSTLSTGIIDDGQGLKREQIPCPWQKEPNQVCFKGPPCPYKHGKYTPEMRESHPKLNERPTTRIILAGALPKKNALHNRFISKALITHIVNPSEFYVVLQDSSNCLCNCKEKLIRDPDEDQFANSTTTFEDFHSMMKGLQREYCIVRERPFQYFAGELVVAKIPLKNNNSAPCKKHGWFRAVVLEDSNNDMDADQAPDLCLKLLDYGTEVIVTTLDVAPLEKFVNYPPMAFNCSLFGISPMLGKWREKALTCFKELVKENDIVLEVLQRGEETIWFDLFHKSPTQVKLYAKYNGSYINVAKVMADLGLGIEWNPFPLRSAVNDVIINHHQIDFALKDITKTEEEKKSLDEEMETILNREIGRLNTFLKIKH